MHSKNETFVFEPALTEGRILKRKNRFVLSVEIDGAIYDCHCPTTGSIGNIVLSDIPCLLSTSHGSARKTPYTVEAISLDVPSLAHKSWVGINQNAANRYVEHCLRTGQLANMIQDAQTVKREPFLGQSKLDFFVGTTYIEVKTPLFEINLMMGDHIVKKKAGNFTAFDRFVRHIHELADSLNEGNTAILLVCFIYDNPRFSPPGRHRQSDYVRDAVRSSIQRGVEVWQVNFSIDQSGVELSRYFEITNDFLEYGSLRR
jgi:sugar fermentation stimulation protein A